MKKLTKQQKAAKKAWATRRMLDNVLAKYGEDTWMVVRALVRNDKDTLTQERYIQGTMRVAAIKANFTRGTYA